MTVFQKKLTTAEKNNSKNTQNLYGSIPINSPRNRDAFFTSTIIPKRVTDVSNIERKVLSIYANEMSQSDIKDIIKDIYGFEISPAQISIITDNVFDELRLMIQAKGLLA